MKVDVNVLSDTELAQKLRQLGANIGPITDSTRDVYQRKLQRWLQNGPTRDSSALEFSPVEPHVRTAARPEVATVSKELPVCNSRSGNIDTVLAAGVHQNHTVSSVRISRSEVIPHVLPCSLTSADCGSESFNETSNGLSDGKRLMKPKAKPITNKEPVVASSDIEIVDRALGVSHVDSSTPLSSSSCASNIRNTDEEGLVRKRFSTYNVSSRPSLHEYKSPGAYDGPSCLPDLNDYRMMLSASRESMSFSTPAEDAGPAEPRRYCDTEKLVWCTVIALAVVHRGSDLQHGACLHQPHDKVVRQSTTVCSALLCSPLRCHQWIFITCLSENTRCCDFARKFKVFI